ncbi:MAG: S41 family peptidase [Bacteroidetes bacterium]|nr:S41 family peptidase [Bacteroidota bacterium]
MEQAAGKKINIWLPSLLAVVLITGMLVGMKVKDTTANKRALTLNSGANYDKFTDILNYIGVKYVDTVNKVKLTEQAINEVLKNLDPHSLYIPAKDLEQVNEPLEGKYKGIGIEFSIVSDTIIVVSPINGGPSDLLGIQSGDRIIKIEDKVVAGTGINNNDVFSLLRGPEDTEVSIHIKRKASANLIKYTITRDEIPINSVDVFYMMNSTTGFIKINRFTLTTYEEFIKALEAMINEGMRKLIIDLRGNPGGYLTAAVEIADELLDQKKVIVYTEGRSTPRKEHNTRREGFFETGDLIILINQGSASASEIIAGAVQDWDRGLILGRRSFGKGLVQEQYNLRDGSALRLTISRYFTPTGRSIQKSYKNGLKDYEEELFKRTENGEFLSADSIPIADSLKFVTPGGKVVYGGGGITPDVFVPLDTSYNHDYLWKVQTKDLLRKFSYNYYSNHKSEFDVYPDLDSFLKGFNVTNKRFKAFTDFVVEAGSPEANDLPENIIRYIKVHIKAQIARQIWDNVGYYRVVYEMDNALNKAYKMINGES